MTAKTFLTLLFLSCFVWCHCQTNNSINVYIEKLQMHWQFRKVGDTLLLTDRLVFTDTFSVRIILIDMYGSYTLTMIDKKTGNKQTFCYKGAKGKYQMDKVANFDTEGNLTKYTYIKMYIPSITTNCNQNKPVKLKIKRTHNKRLSAMLADN